MVTLQNSELQIQVDAHGAELTSIRHQGREYLWEAYPEYWKRHSPVLFPIVGSVWQGEYRSQNGQTYSLGQHGFARDMEFCLVEERADYVAYELRSSEKTFEKYPYPFVLRIGYRLEGRTIHVEWTVINPSTDTPIAFQIGAHPAFYWPLLGDEVIAAGVPAMQEALKADNQRGYFRFDQSVKQITRTLITEGGCVDKQARQTLPLEDGYLPLTTETFAHDALVLEGSQVQEVTLCRQDRTPYLTLSWDAPLVGLWSPPGKNAPFVCIEPWYGRCDEAHYDGLFEDKEWINHLAPGETFAVSYRIKL